jgi:hypothetical protein
MPTIATTSRPAYVYDSQTDSWIPVGVGPHSHSNYVENTLIDAKGDLFVGTAPDTVGRQAVGTNGQVLTVDSSTSTGVAWTTLSLLPSQTGNAGEFLITDGTNASWSNTITANAASAVGLIVKSTTSQTANIQEWQSNTGTVLVRVNSFGSLLVGSGIILNNAGTINMSFGTIGGTISGTMLSIVANASTSIGTIIRGAASQTANLTEWQNSSGTILARVNSAGQFVGDGSQLTGIAAGESISSFMLMGA